MPKTFIHISVRAIARVCIGTYLLLLILHIMSLYLVHGTGMPIDDPNGWLFHFDREGNAPTLFTVALIAQVAVLCAIAARLSRPERLGWILMTAGFLYIGLDEFAGLHELLIPSIRARMAASGALYFAWIIPYGLGALTGAAVLIPWVRRLPRSTFRALTGAAIVYVGFTLALEALGGWYYDGDPARRDLVFDLIATLEESAEMLGLMLFARAIGLHALRELNFGGVAVRGPLAGRIAPPAPEPRREERAEATALR